MDFSSQYKMDLFSGPYFVKIIVYLKYGNDYICIFEIFHQE